MELIKISSTQLKIMLTQDDMLEFKLDSAVAEYNGSDAHKAFRSILVRAKEMSGFDTGDERVFLQMYPSKEGGCEIFVSKTELGNIFTDQIYDTENDPDKAGYESSVRSSSLICWSFSSLELLLKACHALSDVEQGIVSSRAFVDENKKYHILARISTSCGISERINEMIGEYADNIDTDDFLIYIAEHGKEICRDNAISVLSDL